MSKALKNKTKREIRRAGVGANQEFLVEAVYQNICKFIKNENDLPLVGDLTRNYMRSISNIVANMVETNIEKERNDKLAREQLSEKRKEREKLNLNKNFCFDGFSDVDDDEYEDEDEDLFDNSLNLEEDEDEYEDDVHSYFDDDFNEKYEPKNRAPQKVENTKKNSNIESNCKDVEDNDVISLFALNQIKKGKQENLIEQYRENIERVIEEIGKKKSEKELKEHEEKVKKQEEYDHKKLKLAVPTTYDNSGFEKIYALDTNIILNDASNLFNISQDGRNLIVLPETVLDELDNKKEGFDEINFQAREFARILSGAEITDQRSIPVVGKTSVFYITRMKIDHVFVDIIGLNNYDDINESERSIRNDRKILKVVKGSIDDIYHSSITFLTLDAMCRIRATSMNINSELMLNGGDSYESEFIKTIQLDGQYITSDLINGCNVFDVNPDHKPENYCYRFLGSNNEKLLAVVQNDRLVPINEASLNKSLIKPRNEEQKFALTGMCDDFYKVVLIEALAGSGKTLLAISAGLKAIKEGKYEKLIYIRNSIESTDRGEEVGFLSGNEAKFEIYNHPLYDTLDFIARTEFKRSQSNKTPAARCAGGNSEISRAEIENAIKEIVEKLIKQYNIETIWNGAIRGRTLANAFVIVDECLHKEQQLVTNRGLLTVEEIEKLIKDGEWVDVKSVNLSTNKIEFKKLESLKKEHISSTSEKMYEITMEDGSVLKLTGNHKLWCNDKYITVNEIIEIQKTGKEIDLNVFK